MFVLALLFGVAPLSAERDELTRSSVENRLEATQRRVQALQEKQARVMSRLESAAKSGRLRALDAVSRDKLAEHLNSHVDSVKAEVKMLQSLEKTFDFPEYSNFKKYAQQFRTRKNMLGAVLDKMTSLDGIPQMLRLSHEYKKKFGDFANGVKAMHSDAIPAMAKKVAEEKAKEMNALANTNFKDAFTDHDIKMINSYSKQHPEDVAMVESQEIPHEQDIKNADMGPDPYADMSESASDINAPLNGYASDGVKVKEANSFEMTKDGANLDADVPEMKAEETKEEEEEQKPFMVIKIPPKASGAAAVQVDSRSLVLQRNASTVGK